MIRSRFVSPALIALVLVFGCGGGKPQDASAKDTSQQASKPVQLAQAPTGAQSSGGSASISGVVRFEGAPPAAGKVKMDADPMCQQQHTEPVYTEEAVVADGRLKHVFVYVKDGVAGSYPAPTGPATLNQQGCWYTPHVFGLQVNQPLEIVNNDATLHNVNAKPTTNQPFNLAQPVKGMKATKQFAKPEVMVKFKCNVHPWMSAYVGVVAHPFFAVSGADGAFTIAGLPAGTYTLEAWHEKYGTQTQQVTVGDGASKSVEFTFTAP